MIFQYTWQDVLAGHKTLTHRPVKPGDHLGERDGAPAVVSANGRVRWYVGQKVAVQPARTATAVGRIRVVELARADVRALSDADIRAEGVERRADFLSLWARIHDPVAARALTAGALSDAEQAALLAARPAALYDAWGIRFELREAGS